MSASSQSLEIHIHLIDGSTGRFVQDDPAEARKLLESLQPGKIFAQRDLVIAGRYSLTAYPCSAVARVDFVMEGYPGWPFHHNVLDAMQITHEEFQERFLPTAQDVERTERILAPGEPFVGYAEVELLNAERLFVEVRITAESRTPLETGLFLQQLFTGHGIYLRRRGGGAILINPAHIVRISLFPGPPETPPGAWPAHRLTAP